MVDIKMSPAINLKADLEWVWFKLQFFNLVCSIIFPYYLNLHFVYPYAMVEMQVRVRPVY